MNNPKLYQESNVLAKRDVLQCLEECSNEIKWNKEGATVIDIGCGDGGVTTTILKLFIPVNFKELVGCDKSEKMIQYANSNHARDFIRFMVLDIGSDLPDHFREKFDHALSFYALHWIKNQEFAFSNVYELLARGGDCLLMLLGNLPVYDIYRELARIPHWKSLMGDVERYVSPYHDSQDPEKDIEKMMTKIGFTKVKVKCIEKEFIYYDEEILKKIMFAISPYDIPLEIQEDFWKDCMKIFVDMKLIHYSNNDVDDQFNAKINYKSIIVYGQK